MLSKLALHFCLLAFVFVIWLTTDPATTLFVGGVAALLVYGNLLVKECWKSSEAITPFSYHFLWNWAVLGIAAVYFAFVIWYGDSTGFDTVHNVSPKSIAAGYVLCLAGSFLMHFSLRLGSPKPKPISAPKRIIHPLLGLLIFAAGCVVIIAPRGMDMFQGLIAALLRQSPLAILLAVALGATSRRYYWTKLIVGTVALVAANMFAFFPYKTAILQALFPLAIAMWKRSRKMTIAALCAVPVIYVTLIAPYVTAVREQASPITVLTDSANLADDAGGNQLMYRIFEPIEAGFVVHQAHVGGLLWGETFKNIPFALVPRFLWPEKPEYNTAKWFTEYLGYDVNSYTSMTGVGEMYWNFSVPGVLVGVVLVGLMFCSLWHLAEYFGRDAYLGSLLYVMVLVYTFNSGDGSEAFVFVPSILILISPIFFWKWTKQFCAWYFSRPLVSSAARN